MTTDGRRCEIWSSLSARWAMYVAIGLKRDYMLEITADQSLQSY